MTIREKPRRNDLLVAIGDAIRRIRISKNISQEELALMAEVDRSYLGRIERGENNAAMLTLARIAGALDVSITKLMKEAGL